MWGIERDSHVCTTCAIPSHCSVCVCVCVCVRACVCVRVCVCMCMCVAVLQWQISECEVQIQELTEELNKWSYFKVSPILSCPM